MTATFEGNVLDIDGVRVEFDYDIFQIVELPDRIVVNLRWGKIPETDPGRGRNVLAVDRQGNLLWRIEPQGSNPAGNGRPETWVSFVGINLQNDGRLTAAIPIGFCFDVDKETGAISNLVYTK